MGMLHRGEVARNRTPHAHRGQWAGRAHQWSTAHRGQGRAHHGHAPKGERLLATAHHMRTGDRGLGEHNRGAQHTQGGTTGVRPSTCSEHTRVPPPRLAVNTPGPLPLGSCSTLRNQVRMRGGTQGTPLITPHVLSQASCESLWERESQGPFEPRAGGSECSSALCP